MAKDLSTSVKNTLFLASAAIGPTIIAAGNVTLNALEEALQANATNTDDNKLAEDFFKNCVLGGWKSPECASTLTGIFVMVVSAGLGAVLYVARHKLAECKAKLTQSIPEVSGTQYIPAAHHCIELGESLLAPHTDHSLELGGAPPSYIDATCSAQA